MLLKNNRRSIVCACLATSFFIHSNLVCFASESTATLAASAGAEIANSAVDFGELPIANDMLAAVENVEKPDYGSDELFDDKTDGSPKSADRSCRGDAMRRPAGGNNAAPTSNVASKSIGSDATKSDTKAGAVASTAVMQDVVAAESPPVSAESAPVALESPPVSVESAPVAVTSEPAEDLRPTAIAQSFGDKVILRGDASVAPSEAARQIDELTKQILFKEIELQRYNLHYTMEVAKQGRWKGWRYAMFQEINSGLGLAGSVISTSNRGQALHNSKRVNLHTQLAANYIPMIGSIIGASAAAGEFGINTYHEMVARSKGFSPTAAVKKVRGLQQDIDSLLDKREALMRIEASEPSLHEYVAVDEVEGRILKDMRDQSLMEFERFHISARKVLGFQQTQYLFDVAKYTTNAIGCNWAYLSLANHHRIWNGRAGVMFAISGQLTCYAPILSRLFAKGYGEFTKMGMKDISKEARETSISKLSADLADLDKIIKQHKEHNAEVATTVVMQGDYEAHERAFTNEISSAQKKSDAAKLTATQNIGAGLFVGGLKTASGVLFLVPGFNPNYNKSDERSSRVTNDLLFTSAILGLPAGVFSMLDTLRIQVRGEINRHKAAKEGKLPGQLAIARLKELDQMERKLKAL